MVQDAKSWQHSYSKLHWHSYLLQDPSVKYFAGGCWNEVISLIQECGSSEKQRLPFPALPPPLL